MTVPAACAPDLDTTPARRAGTQVTVLHGTIIATRRVRCTRAHRAWWVHRKRTCGVNLQALCDQIDNLLRGLTRAARATHDLTAARQHQVLTTAGRHRVTLWAGQGAGPSVITSRPARASR